MLSSVDLFLCLATQWRWTGAGMAGAFRTGLDYNAIDRVAASIGVEMTRQMFDDIRVLEAAALAEWSRK